MVLHTIHHPMCVCHKIEQVSKTHFRPVFICFANASSFFRLAPFRPSQQMQELIQCLVRDLCGLGTCYRYCGKRWRNLFFKLIRSSLSACYIYTLRVTLCFTEHTLNCVTLTGWRGVVKTKLGDYHFHYNSRVEQRNVGPMLAEGSQRSRLKLGRHQIRMRSVLCRLHREMCHMWRGSVIESACVLFKLQFHRKAGDRIVGVRIAGVILLVRMNWCRCTDAHLTNV